MVGTPEVLFQIVAFCFFFPKKEGEMGA